MFLTYSYSLDSISNFLGHNLFERSLSCLLLGFIIYWLYFWIIDPVWQSTHSIIRALSAKGSPLVFVEIIPPKYVDKTPLATRELLAILHKILAINDVASLEILSSYKDGIRYLVGANLHHAPTLQMHLVTYLPGAQVRILGPQATAESSSQVFEFVQTSNRTYPLRHHDSLDQSDPVAYITGAMTKLRSGELVRLQIVLTPYRPLLMSRKIHLKNQRGLMGILLASPWWIWLPVAAVGFLLNNLVAVLLLAIALLFVLRFLKHWGMISSSPICPDASTRILGKLSQPLFRADIRVIVTANQTRLHGLYSGVSSALKGSTNSDLQSLTVRRLYPKWLGRNIANFKAKYRTLSFLPVDSNILSVEEVASIYHFPYGTIVNEGIAKTLTVTLPAPLGFRRGQFDILLGKNHYRGSTTSIGLSASERERHLFIVGGTGTGKTTLMKYAIVQDIRNGKGVAVVDPHGELAQELLAYIPEERIADVIYFNPADLGYPIGLNILEIPEGLKGDQLLDAKDFITETVVSILRKTFSDDAIGGHRIEYILRNTVLTALTVKNATLFTVYDLLTDSGYRRSVVDVLEQKWLRNFWHDEFSKAGDYQQVKMISGVTSKIGRYLASVSASRVLGQEKSTINFDEILDGKILICNLAKGLIGEDTSEILGIALLAELQLAAFRRIKRKKTDRSPFYVYVDEFQNFATTSFSEMLSESRKYKLFLTMAEQTTSQQDDVKIVGTILANAGTVISFRTGNPADERLMLPLFRPYLRESDIANLPPYNFYMRASAIKSQEPLSGETLVLEDAGDNNIARRVVGFSREHYAKKYNLPAEPKGNPKEEKTLSGKQTITEKSKRSYTKDPLKEVRKKGAKTPGRNQIKAA